MRLVVEHARGHRRGERQVFVDPTRVRLGRHPDSDVSFDPTADLDASSRHAEIALEGSRYVLRDVGSSNGTLVAGELVHEFVLQPERRITVDLGAGGPRLTVWLAAGEEDPPEDAHPEIAPRDRPGSSGARAAPAPRPRFRGPVLVALGVLAAALVLLWHAL